MKHNVISRLLVLLACFGLFGSFTLNAQTYFQEPFNTMVDVGAPADSLVAPPGWDAERVSTVLNPIITPPRVTHRTSPTSAPARVDGNGARDFELATFTGTEWVVNRPSPNNFFVNDTVQINGTKPPVAFTPVGTTALWFNDWFAAGSGNWWAKCSPPLFAHF